RLRGGDAGEAVDGEGWVDGIGARQIEIEAGALLEVGLLARIGLVVMGIGLCAHEGRVDFAFRIEGETEGLELSQKERIDGGPSRGEAGRVDELELVRQLALVRFELGKVEVYAVGKAVEDAD